MSVYVAILPTYYHIIGIGDTADEAKEAVVKEYVRTKNAGYGLLALGGRTLRTVAEVEAYIGIKVVGPLLPGEAITE